MPLYSPAASGGTTVLDGTALPISTDGVDGNYYVDTDSNIMYGPKDSAGLGPPINLLADTVPGGTNGSSFRAGNKYQAVVAGQVVGARFYRWTPQSTTTRQVAIYNSGGTQVALSNSSVETVGTAGWITVTFATPWAFTAGQIFTLAYDDTQTPYTTGAPTLTTPDFTFIEGRYGTIAGGYPGSSGAFSFHVDAVVRVAGDVWPVAIDGEAGGSPPGGSTTQVQFNDSGAFGGDAGLTYVKATDSLTIGGNLTLTGLITGSQLVINSSNSPFSIGGASSVSVAGDLAIGYGARASLQSIAIGYAAGASVAPNASTIVGFNANAAANGVAIGSSSNAYINSFALGAAAVASGTGSIAMGYSAQAPGTSMFVSGADLTPINNVYFGKGYVNATPTVWTLNGTGGSGTDIAGGDIAIAGGAGTGSGVGGSILLKTAPAGGSGGGAGTPATRLTIDSKGIVTVAQAMKLTPLTVATLPASPTTGQMATVSDGTAALAWGATVSGGGSTPYMVWYNGSAWTVMGK